MLTHSLVNTPNDLPGLTLFADFWVQTTFYGNPASYAGDIRCFTYMSLWRTPGTALDVEQ
jgi:hypothetical protein